MNYAETKLAEIEEDGLEMTRVTCRICDKPFDFDMIAAHTESCELAAQLTQRLI